MIGIPTLRKDNLPPLKRRCMISFGVAIRTSRSHQGMGDMHIPGLNVAIVSPFDIWCAGMEKLVHEVGLSICLRCSSVEKFVNSTGLADVDLLIISRCQLDSSYFEPIANVYDGIVIVVVEPADG